MEEGQATPSVASVLQRPPRNPPDLLFITDLNTLARARSRRSWRNQEAVPALRSQRQQIKTHTHEPMFVQRLPLGSFVLNTTALPGPQFWKCGYPSQPDTSTKPPHLQKE